MTNNFFYIDFLFPLFSIAASAAAIATHDYGYIVIAIFSLWIYFAVLAFEDNDHFEKEIGIKEIQKQLNELESHEN